MAPIKTLATQDKSIDLHKNLRIKVMKCCANIYFNRQCLIKKATPKYAKIKIPYTSPATNITQKKTQIIRLKDEIKFLYMKKEKQKNDLYRIQLKAANELGNTWYTILDSIHESINQELERKYKTIEEKLKKKSCTYLEKKIDNMGNFHPRVINKTFTNYELTLPHKGLKILIININNWIKTLSVESETAITQLPISEKTTYVTKLHVT
jgi:hypothetical protein